MILYIVALTVAWLATGLTNPVLAQDYARELRWEQEVIGQLVVGDAVKIKTTDDREFLALFTKGKPAQPAILIVHGVGVNPDFGVTGQLRIHLNDLGYTTLAIQMPVQSKEAKLEDYYPKVFPNAKDRIGQSIAWLQSMGFSKPVLLSHSMGSWMSNEYLDERHRKSELSAWICLSLTGGYSWTTRSYQLPLFDIYGEFDIPVSVSSAWRRASVLSRGSSKQWMVPGASPDFSGKEKLMAAEIQRFLQAL
jgi:Protein of unknown function (DUF3530)